MKGQSIPQKNYKGDKQDGEKL